MRNANKKVLGDLTWPYLTQQFPDTTESFENEY